MSDWWTNDPIAGSNSASASRPRITITPVQQSFLNSVAAGESPDYNTMYGGGRFEELNDHPRQNIPITSGPNAGRTSSAAGRYQFLQSTWDEAKNALGLTDFSPESQDAAAVWLAERDYKARTKGRDLWADLEGAKDNPAKLNFVAGALGKTWTSLPGGAEPNRATSGFGQRMSQEFSAQSRRPQQEENWWANDPVAPAAQEGDTIDQRFAGDSPAAAPTAELKGALRERQSPRERGRSEGRERDGWQAAIAGASEGSSGNISDYPQALAGGLISAVRGDGFSKGYSDEWDRLQGQREGMREANPGATLAGILTGAVATGLPAAGAVTAPSVLGRVAQSAAIGGALGGAQGAASGEGAKDRLDKLTEGAILGGAIGGVGEGLISGAARGFSRAFGAAKEAGDGVVPAERIAAAEEFGIPLTRGQATGNVGQQAFEEAARNNARGPMAGEAVRSFDARQAEAVAQARAGISESLGGAASADEAGAAIAQGIKERAGALRSASEAAYDRAGAKEANIAIDEVAKLGQRVAEKLEAGGVRLDTYGNYPGAQSAMNILRRVSGFEGSPANENVVAQSLQGLEQARKALVQVKPASPEDARALKAIRSSYDEWITDAVDKRLFSGDPSALEDLKEARSLWSQYRGLTKGGKDDATPIVAKIANEERTGAEVANWLLGTAGAGQAGRSARVALEVRNAVGQKSEAWEALRQAAWMKMIEPKTGSGPQAVSKSILDFVQGQGAPVAKVLFSDTEIKQMVRLANIDRMRIVDPRATNRGQSGYEIARLVQGKAGVAQSALGVGAAYTTGDPKYLALAALPLMRSASSLSKGIAATRAAPSQIATGTGRGLRATVQGSAVAAPGMRR